MTVLHTMWPWQLLATVAAVLILTQMYPPDTAAFLWDTPGGLSLVALYGPGADVAPLAHVGATESWRPAAEIAAVSAVDVEETMGLSSAEMHTALSDAHHATAGDLDAVEAAVHQLSVEIDDWCAWQLGVPVEMSVDAARQTLADMFDMTDYPALMGAYA